jgi:integrase
MKMAKPKGMYLRGSTWWARKDVPVPLREIIGQTSLQKTLETSDLSDAKVRFHGVMQQFEAKIADAWRVLRQEPRKPETPTFTLDLGPGNWMVPDLRTPDQKIKALLEDAKLIPTERDPMPMATLFEQWKTEKKPKMNTAAEYERALEVFMEVCGEIPVDQYAVEHAGKWKAHVVALPDLAHSTRGKWFGSIRTLFRFADRNDYLRADPFAKITLERPKRAKESRRQEWELVDLKKLFASPIYTEQFRPKAGAGEAAYWLPVLALYHGFRAGELCQLDRKDLVQKDGIWCLRIRPSDDDDEGPAKSIKTKESIRTVPLHKRVIELGLLQYAKTLKGAKLFPMIRPDVRGRWSGHFSKWFGRYRRSIGLDQRWTDFHSFRHTWKTAAKAAEIPEEIHDAISGHDSGSVGRSYGSVPIPRLKREVDKVRFDVIIPKWKTS